MRVSKAWEKWVHGVDTDIDIHICIYIDRHIDMYILVIAATTKL